MTAKVNLYQYVIFTKPRNFDTADIKCFKVVYFVLLLKQGYRFK